MLPFGPQPPRKFCNPWYNFYEGKRAVSTLFLCGVWRNAWKQTFHILKIRIAYGLEKYVNGVGRNQSNI
jgi:hypothetical protein